MLVAAPLRSRTRSILLYNLKYRHISSTSPLPYATEALLKDLRNIQIPLSSSHTKDPSPPRAQETTSAFDNELKNNTQIGATDEEVRVNKTGETSNKKESQQVGDRGGGPYR
jgi:hypothetical protein